jgi:hypothetical protein
MVGTVGALGIALVVDSDALLCQGYNYEFRDVRYEVVVPEPRECRAS